MTISSETNRVSYVGAGTTGPFAIPYYFLENDDLRVVVQITATGAETVLVLTTDYTLTGAGVPAGGSLTLTGAYGALPASKTISIIRDPDKLQGIDYAPNDAFPADTTERGFDKLTMLIQRVYDIVTRSPRQPDGDTANIGTLPAKAVRASMFFAFNANGDPIASPGNVAGSVPVSAFMATVLDDADAATARGTLGAAASGANTDITSLTTVTLNGTTTVAGALAFSGDISPAQITANQNDYNPTSLSTASTLRLSADARRTISGLQGGADGRCLTIHNVGTFPIVFKFEDAGSSAANRFSFGHTLSGGHSMSIQYDSTSSRWRCTFKEDPAGTIKPFAGGTIQEGYLARDGSNVSRTTYAALFNEIGTTWGVGDGSTTFGVGDDRRRSWVGSGGSGTATLGNAVGNTGGAETHTLVTGEIPSHNHSIDVGSNTAGSGQISFLVNNVVGQLSSANTGGGGAHNTYHPAAVVTSIIKY